MRERSWAFVGALLLVVPVLTLTMGTAAGQTPAASERGAAAAGGATPRTPWGHPDLQGTWDNHTITPLERPARFAGREFLTAEEVVELEARALLETTDEARQDGERDVSTAYNDFWWDRATNVVTTRRTSLIVDPPDGKVPPLVASAAERQGETERAHRPLRATGGFEGGRGADSWTDRSLWERCITQGLPRISSGAYNSNIQLVQTPDHVVIHHEMIHESRIVPLDGRPHVGDGIRQYMGDSRGRWDGDTLVVHTTNFSDHTNFRGSTSGLQMTERFRRIDADTLEYEVTFEDPTTWTRPWTATTQWSKSQGRIYEYACHEGNYGMVGILNGARVEERTPPSR